MGRLLPSDARFLCQPTKELRKQRKAILSSLHAGPSRINKKQSVHTVFLGIACMDFPSKFNSRKVDRLTQTQTQVAMPMPDTRFTMIEKAEGDQ